MNTAIFFADGFEEIEGLTVVDMFRRAGIPIQTVSISDSLTVTGSHDIKVQADCLLCFVCGSSGCDLYLFETVHCG